ncbi:MAG: porin family protein [Bacteroidota bacterium]
MQASYFRNSFYLHRDKVVVLGLLLCMTLSANAQKFKWARENNPRYDERFISYGFVIGIHQAGYQVKYSDKFVTQNYDTVHAVMAPMSGGFSLGFLVNMRLYDVLDLRLMPKAGFYDYKLEYDYTDRTSKSQLVETTMMEFPLLLKYKSLRRGNVRMYMIGGFTGSFELSGKNDVESTTANLSVKKTNVTVDAGFGFDFYFPLFKFSPEIRFSRGVTNVLGDDQSVFRDPIKRLNTNMVGVYFIFQ